MAPWNGGGGVTLTQDFTADRDAGLPDSKIQAELVDDVLSDIADMLEDCINRNGETPVAANINWGGFKITNYGSASAATDVPKAAQIADNSVQYGGTTSGSANAYTATMTFLSAVTAGTRLLLKANHTNNGAATLNINGVGAVAIRATDNSVLTGGEIVNGQLFEVVNDGTNFKLVSPGAGAVPSLLHAARAVASQAVSTDGATLNIDMSSGWNVSLSLGHTITSFTVSNWPAAGIFAKLTLEVNNTGAFNISDFPGTVVWAAGNIPSATSGNGKKDTLILTSHDGGTNFRGYIVASDMT